MAARRSAVAHLLLLAVFPAGCSSELPARSFEYIETVRVPAQRGKVELWLPVPPSDAFQEVKLLEVRANSRHRLTADKEFGNSILFLESSGLAPLEARVSYRVRRRFQDGFKQKRGPSLTPKERGLHTTPRGLVVVNERVRELAQSWVGESQAPVEIARSAYERILDYMAYDKTAAGWGQGDSARACIVALGNCTDFHSLFQSIAIAKDVPARFKMGIMLDGKKRQPIGKAYHCWAEFHDGERGWIPVDISEAWKVKAGRKEMGKGWVRRYFGAVDENRLLLSSGREIRLEPPQGGPPLNYFAYPYLEVEGKPSEDFAFEREAADLPAAG